MLLVSGEPNEVVQELWQTKAHRSFKEIDGRRRVRDLLEQMVQVDTEPGERWAVYPGKQEALQLISVQ